ncbi:hypothetical protein [Hymenobacter sp. B81]|uniref:hypothetical protein n=1 Tax=Hymenobacter sp. B81 TaxID=3344878 RepID=UPI0037DC21E7
MKKVRGRRRQLRRFAQSSHLPVPWSLRQLHQDQYDYARPGLAPWYGSSFASNPPTRIRQEVFKALLATHTQWQCQLQDYAEPHYLAVWVMNSVFRESQVVAGVGSRREYYAGVFGLPDPAAPPLPPEYQAVPGAGQLRWTAYQHEVPVGHWEFDDAAEATQFLRRVRYRTVADAAGNPLYLIRLGRVWVGKAQ